MMPPGASAARPLVATVRSSDRSDPAVSPLLIGATISAAWSQVVCIYGAGSVANRRMIRAGNVRIYPAAGGSVTKVIAASLYRAQAVWMLQPIRCTAPETVASDFV